MTEPKQQQQTADEIFAELYEEHREAFDDLAGSDNPAAPLAEMVIEGAKS